MHSLTKYLTKFEEYKMKTVVNSKEDRLEVIKEINSYASKLMELLRGLLPEIDSLMDEKPKIAIETAETAYMLAVCLDLYLSDEFKTNKELESSE